MNSNDIDMLYAEKFALLFDKYSAIIARNLQRVEDETRREMFVRDILVTFSNDYNALRTEKSNALRALLTQSQGQ